MTWVARYSGVAAMACGACRAGGRGRSRRIRRSSVSMKQMKSYIGRSFLGTFLLRQRRARHSRRFLAKCPGESFCSDLVAVSCKRRAPPNSTLPPARGRASQRQFAMLRHILPSPAGKGVGGGGRPQVARRRSAGTSELRLRIVSPELHILLWTRRNSLSGLLLRGRTRARRQLVRFSIKP